MGEGNQTLCDTSIQKKILRDIIYEQPFHIFIEIFIQISISYENEIKSDDFRLTSSIH